MNPDRQLLIYYRHVHIKMDKMSRDPNKQRPEWFSHEICFRNLLQTIHRDPLAGRVRLIIVYDGPVEDFAADFVAAYYANGALGLEIQFIRGGSDRNSFLITLGLARASGLRDGDLIYLLENDYLHQYGWVSKVFELYDSGLQPDYVSLYDHRDKYHYEMYASLTSRLVYSPSHHWRTTPSTCASFMFEKRVLERDYAVLSMGLNDHYFFTRLIAEQGRVLLTPVPGLSTHSMAGYLSPTVDWAKLAQEATTGANKHNQTAMEQA